MGEKFLLPFGNDSDSRLSVAEDASNGRGGQGGRRRPVLKGKELHAKWAVAGLAVATALAVGDENDSTSDRGHSADDNKRYGGGALTEFEKVGQALYHKPFPDEAYRSRYAVSVRTTSRVMIKD